MKLSANKIQKIVVGLLIILAIGSAAFLLYKNFADKSEKVSAVVSISGKEVCAIDLSKDREPYEIDLQEQFNVPVILEVRDHAICVKHSECPDQICVNAGWLRHEMDIAVCMPNQVAVVIVPTADIKN